MNYIFFPDTIKVNGIDYRIIQQEHAPDHRGSRWMGRCDEQKATIHVNSTLDPQKKIQVIFHELAHAYLAEAGIDEHDEIEVQVMAAGFYSLFDQLISVNFYGGKDGEQ